MNFPTIPPPVERVRDYAACDAALYALAVGAGTNVDDINDRRLCLEEDLVPLPTFATALGWDNTWVHAVGVDVRRVLHTHQRICVENPLPPSARVVITSRVAHVFDRGAGEAAVFVHETVLRDAATGAIYCTSELTAIARGAGGFAGAPQPRRAPPAELLTEYEGAVTSTTSPIQALLYRLTGDRNPLHVRPEVASAAGFQQPLLHGLCTFGYACRALVLRACAGNPARIREFQGRFAAPVYPGQTLATRIRWSRTGAVLQTLCEETGEVVLDGGRASFF